MIIKEVNSLRCLRVLGGVFFFVKWLWWKCWNFLGEVKCSPPRLLLRIIKRFEILINIWYCLNLTLNHLIKINRLIGAPLIKSLCFIRGNIICGRTNHPILWKKGARKNIFFPNKARFLAFWRKNNFFNNFIDVTILYWCNSFKMWIQGAKPH